MTPLDSVTTRIAGLIASFTSRRKGSNRLLILCYHRVLPEPDPIQPECIDRAMFENHLAVLTGNFHVMRLSDAARQLRDGRLPRRAVCITFDDGYADNFEIALPVLRSFGAPATVFVASGMIDGGCMWNDSIVEAIRQTAREEIALSVPGVPTLSLRTTGERALATKLILLELRRLPPEERTRETEHIVSSLGTGNTNGIMLTSDQVAELHRYGIEIGAHTVSHPILSRLTGEDAQREIRQSRQVLSDIIQEEIHGFAYPNGVPGVDYDRSHVDAVAQAGFSYAVSTASGTGGRDADVFQLPRFKPWNQSAARFGFRLALEYRASASLFA